jgi:hypothetical protein
MAVNPTAQAAGPHHPARARGRDRPDRPPHDLLRGDAPRAPQRIPCDYVSELRRRLSPSPTQVMSPDSPATSCWPSLTRSMPESRAPRRGRYRALLAGDRENGAATEIRARLWRGPALSDFLRGVRPAIHPPLARPPSRRIEELAAAEPGQANQRGPTAARCSHPRGPLRERSRAADDRAVPIRPAARLTSYHLRELLGRGAGLTVASTAPRSGSSSTIRSARRGGPDHRPDAQPLQRPPIFADEDAADYFGRELF